MTPKKPKSFTLNINTFYLFLSPDNILLVPIAEVSVITGGDRFGVDREPGYLLAMVTIEESEDDPKATVGSRNLYLKEHSRMELTASKLLDYPMIGKIHLFENNTQIDLGTLQSQLNEALTQAKLKKNQQRHNQALNLMHDMSEAEREVLRDYFLNNSEPQG